LQFKKECNKIIADKMMNNSSSSSNLGSNGQLQNITEDVFEDAVDAVDQDVSSEDHHCW